MSAENVNILTSPHSPWHLVPLTQHFSSLSRTGGCRLQTTPRHWANKLQIKLHMKIFLLFTWVALRSHNKAAPGLLWSVFITRTVIRSAEGPCAAACQRGGKAPGRAAGALTELYWPRLCWLSRGQAAVQSQASSVFTSDPGRPEFFPTPC